MYSRHRVAGYSIDHVIKFLFFLLVPVVILDIMISCFVIFSMRGIWAKFLIVLCVVCGLGVASSGYAADERPVVRIGFVDTFSPEFYISTYAATIQYLKRQLPQYRFESVEFTNVDSFTRAVALMFDFLVSSS